MTTAPAPSRGALPLAAAILTALLLPAQYGCNKQDQPADQPGKQGKPSDGGEDRAALQKQIDESQAKLRQIGLALHSFNDTYKQLPPAAICDKKTRMPLLSWRVAILPYVEEIDLYKQFKLDEPWDSEHNKKLLAKVPAVYAPPAGVTAKVPHATFYRGFVTPYDPKFFRPELQGMTAWAMHPSATAPFGATGARFPASFPDGTSNTILVVEAGEAVPWTKPEELPYDGKQPLPKLGGLFKDGYNALMADGQVYFISRQIDDKSLRGLITAKGAEVEGVTDTLKAKGLIK